MEIKLLWAEFKKNRKQFWRIIGISFAGVSISWLVLVAVILSIILAGWADGLTIGGLILCIYGSYPATFKELEKINSAQISGIYRQQIIPLRMAIYLIGGLILTCIGLFISK